MEMKDPLNKQNKGVKGSKVVENPYKLFLWGAHSNLSDDQLQNHLYSMIPHLSGAFLIKTGSSRRWRVCTCRDRSTYEYLLSLKPLELKQRDLSFEPFLKGAALIQAVQETNKRRVLVKVSKKWINNKAILHFFNTLSIQVEKIYAIFSKNKAKSQSGPTHKHFSVLLKSPVDAEYVIQQRMWRINLKDSSFTVIEVLPFVPRGQNSLESYGSNSSHPNSDPDLDNKARMNHIKIHSGSNLTRDQNSCPTSQCLNNTNFGSIESICLRDSSIKPFHALTQSFFDKPTRKAYHGNYEQREKLRQESFSANNLKFNIWCKKSSEVSQYGLGRVLGCRAGPITSLDGF